jgi:TPR repeat protein
LAYFYLKGEFGIKKDLYKAIELLQKAVGLNDSRAMVKLANFYLNGDQKGLIKKDLNLSAFYFFKSSQIDDRNQNSSLVEFQKIIENNKIEWKKEYHVYWKSSSDLNKQIIILLLISKHRKKHQNTFLKGIVMKIIQFLCHFKQVIPY